MLLRRGLIRAVRGNCTNGFNSSTIKSRGYHLTCTHLQGAVAAAEDTLLLTSFKQSGAGNGTGVIGDSCEESLPLLLQANPDDDEKAVHKRQLVQGILQGNGFGTGQILHTSSVLRLSPGVVENYIEIMKETCFNEIKLRWIVKFKNVYKQQLKYLLLKGITPSHQDILRNYFNVLEMEKSIQNDIWNSLPQDISRVTLLELRKEVTRHYLGWRLDVDKEDIGLAFSKYPRIPYRSFRWMNENLKILMNDLGFSGDKIAKHFYLIQADPKNTSTIVHNLGSLSGVPIHQLVHSRPKILMTLASSLLEIQELYAQHCIPTGTIAKFPEIYTLAPKTVKARLEELDTIPEFRPLKGHPRVGRLLYYQNKAKLRLDVFKNHNINVTSLHLLSSDTKRYKRLMKNTIKTRGCDVTTFITSYLNSSSGSESDKMEKKVWTSVEVRKNLMRQPNWLHCSVSNAKDSVQFLDSFKIFSKSQIFNALPIVLYPSDALEKEFDNVIKSQEANLSDEYFLHMVLYFMERIVHFSGDGVWNTRKLAIPHDDDESSTISDDSNSETNTLNNNSHVEVVFRDLHENSSSDDANANNK